MMSKRTEAAMLQHNISKRCSGNIINDGRWCQGRLIAAHETKKSGAICMGHSPGQYHW